MAKIKGIEIKGLREFKGRDWEGAQGNIYIDGVKAGWYLSLIHISTRRGGNGKRSTTGA